MTDLSMKKKSLSIIVLIFALSLSVFILYFRFSNPDIPLEEGQVEEGQDNNDGMRGVWGATVFNLDYPASPTISSQELRSQADEILDNAASYGFNAVFYKSVPVPTLFIHRSFTHGVLILPAGRAWRLILDLIH